VFFLYTVNALRRGDTKIAEKEEHGGEEGERGIKK
jgi:hypothetical protein